MGSQESRVTRFFSVTKHVFSCHHPRKQPGPFKTSPTAVPLDDDCDHEAIATASTQAGSKPADGTSFDSGPPNIRSHQLRHMRSVGNLFDLFTTKHDSGFALGGMTGTCPDIGEDVPPEDHKAVYDANSQSNKDDKSNEDGTSDEDNEPNKCGEHDRREFGKIRGISVEALESLVLHSLPDDVEQLRTCRIKHRKEGSFHHCVFLDVYIDGTLHQQYVLKIPAHGTASSWKEADAYMLRNEAVLIQHIRHHTACPVPEIVAYDETLDNIIGAPFILMKKIPGMSALDLWQGRHLPNPPTIDEAYLDADMPKTQLQIVRKRFLSSLARAMSKLQTLKFDRIGVPVFDDPQDNQPSFIGPIWRWHSKSKMTALTPVGPFNSSAEFFQAGLAKAWSPAAMEDNDLGMSEFQGLHKLLSIVLASEPFGIPDESELSDSDDSDDDEDAEFAKYIEPADEYFVLRHDDLDLQNILVDLHGNVTGIIDWDGCMAVPRCIGYTSLPTFLRRDWDRGYDMSQRPFLTWSFQSYRNNFSATMGQTCSNGTIPVKYTDAKYTRKSAMYQAVFAALYEGECCIGLVENLLAEIDVFRRVDLTDFCIRLGKGWPAAETVLKQKIAILLYHGY